MEAKKISFGFSKIQKKPEFQSSVPLEKDNKRELIKCLEGQSIKLLEENPTLSEELLVIPLKEGTTTAAAFASLRARHNALHNIIDAENETNSSISKTVDNLLANETIEQKAARELLAAVNKKNSISAEDQTNVVIPKPDELPLDGAKEPTFDDYESVPISKYGYAMLRGMGWKELPKDKDDKKDLEGQFVRPKGMGLGADKIAMPKPLLVPPDSNEKLEIKKNACVRILAGKHKDLYGQIEGFDDHAGRIIVKLALGGNYASLNEFLVQPVSKKEYVQYSKVINSAKYEEYKKFENAQGQIILKPPKEERSTKQQEDRKHVVKQERLSPDSFFREANSSKIKSENSVRHKWDASKQEESRRRQKDDYRHEEARRSRSKSSSCPSSDYQQRVKKKKSSKPKRHKVHSRDRHRSKNSSSDDEKRHKKKTKKSKRPRSRSRDRRS